MAERDPKLTVLLFNECINSRDAEALAALMAEDYVFISTSGTRLEGKERNAAGWRQFFETYPDYVNHFELIVSRGAMVYVTGHSTCSCEDLDGPAIWVAALERGLITLWQIYFDTPENRVLLGLPVAS